MISVVEHESERHDAVHWHLHVEDPAAVIHPKAVADLRLPRPVDRTRGVIVSSVRPPRWLLMRLVLLCKEANWVALRVSGLGDVVVWSPSGHFPAVGYVFRAEASAERARVIGIGGPPRSGKSVLYFALKGAIRQRLPEPVAARVTFKRASPDGEGDWFYRAEQDVRDHWRDKREWDYDFVVKTCDVIDGIASQSALVLLDLGGRIDEWNLLFMGRCTHAIVVSSTDEGLGEWCDAWTKLNKPVIATVKSELNGDTAIHSLSPLSITMSGLARENRQVQVPAHIVDACLCLGAEFAHFSPLKDSTA